MAQKDGVISALAAVRRASPKASDLAPGISDLQKHWLTRGGVSLPGAAWGLWQDGRWVPTLCRHIGRWQSAVEKAWVWCLSSCYAPDRLGPQASHLEKNNLFPQRELCGLAEMV